MSHRLAPALAAVALAALLAVSVAVRSPCGSACSAEPDTSAAALVGVDEATGAVLVDLDDDTSSSERDAIEAALVEAIAPYEWPSGDDALGVELEHEAQLFRIFPPQSEVADILRALRGDASVEGVEVERTWSLPEADMAAAARGQAPAPSDQDGVFVPDDPYYPFQWHLDQIGMPEAWTMARGRGVVVAVIDTGVAYRTEDGFIQAPDLAGTSFVPGRDFVDGDAFPDDEHGHGTHVAGTIAQSTHNGLGVAGVAPDASIMPLRVLDRNGSGGWGSIAASIRWAADHGAHVINMSLGGGMRSRTVERAIDYAHSRGVVIVAAAGNASRSTVEYPARHDHVIAVGAVRFDRTLSFYSSYGRGLDIVAPGGDLRVDQNGDGMPDGVLQNTIVNRDPSSFDYLAWQGTSMATPHVAGVAALLVGAGITDPDAVEHAMRSSAMDLGDPEHYSSGLVQASAALHTASSDYGAARGLLALVMLLGVAFGLRRRGELATRLGPALLTAFAVAGGLAIFAYVPGLGGLGAALAAGGPGTGAAMLGSHAAFFALSALVPLAAVALLLHLGRARPILLGLCVGTAAFLVFEAIQHTVALALIPWWAAGPWLLANAAACLWLGRQVARR